MGYGVIVTPKMLKYLTVSPIDVMWGLPLQNLTHIGSEVGHFIYIECCGMIDSSYWTIEPDKAVTCLLCLGKRAH